VDALRTDGDPVFVHLDARVDAEAFSQLPLIAERHRVGWGGFGMIRATNALLAAAGAFDFAYLLSGQCFPLRPVSWLKAELADGRDRIDARPMPASKPLRRLASRHPNAAPKWAQPALRRLINLRKPRDFQTLFGIAPYAGSQWWCLRRDTVEAIARFRAARPDYDAFMRWSDVPDECYYQTLAAHLSGDLGPSLTAAVWREPASHPKTLDFTDVERLAAQPVFAARKVTPAMTPVLQARLQLAQARPVQAETHAGKAASALVTI
jgi:hypothetical protein